MISAIMNCKSIAEFLSVAFATDKGTEALKIIADELGENNLSLISMVMNGRRRPSPRFLSLLARRFEWKGNECAYAWILVGLQFERDEFSKAAMTYLQELLLETIKPTVVEVSSERLFGEANS